MKNLSNHSKSSFISLFFFLLMILWLFNGCLGSKPVTTRFYHLEFPTDVSFENEGKLEAVYIDIMDIEVHPAFASYEIAIRENSNELRYFANHRWASRPEQSLANYITNYYKRNKNFQIVDPRFISHYNYYKLGTTVHQLEVLKEGKDFHARLHIEFKLTEPAANKLILEHRVVKSVLLDGRDLNLFTKVISELLLEELQTFSGEIMNHLAD
jgi:ABC-type uncharacterized transport system auxiliary subunit